MDYKNLAHDLALAATNNDPKNPLFTLHYGHLLYTYQQLDKSKQYYLKTLEYDADLTEAHFNLAAIYLDENSEEEAIKHYMTVHKQLKRLEKRYKNKPDPDTKNKIDRFQNARISLAQHYFKIGQPSKAYELINIIPVSVEKYELLAEYYEVINQKEAAISLYQQLNSRLKTNQYDEKNQPASSMNKNTICIGIETPESDWSVDDSLIELEELGTTAGLTIVQKLSQNRIKPNQLSYIGKGKLEELQNIIENNDIQIALFDDELSPMQQRHIENTLKIKILDRTSLVLDIFSQRARTKEAQIQIELAQLQYIQPRLRRMWTHLSRLGGGIGTRGPGETQLEVDRREVGKRIQKLKRDLLKVKKTRENQRKKN